jgi:hypothetical protein
MAEYALIDSYLEVVSRRLEHRSDAVDLRDELADHLLESTDRARARGLDRESAQRSTLDRFGDPHIVAGMLAAVPTKGIDMVHTLGRSAGVLALISAALWIVVIFAGLYGLIDYLDRTWSTDEYMWQSIVQTLAILSTSVTLVAVNLRHSHRLDALTGVVLAAAVVATLVSFGFGWAFLSWGIYLAVALAVTVARLSGEPEVRGIVSAALLIVVPVLLVIGSFFGLQALVSEADAPLTSLVERQIDLGMFIGTAVIAVLLASGLAVMGLRLRAATALLSVKEPAAFA